MDHIKNINSKIRDSRVNWKDETTKVNHGHGNSHANTYFKIVNEIRKCKMGIKTITYRQ